MSRALTAFYLTTTLAFGGCAFEANADGYVFKTPGEDQSQEEDLPTNPEIHLGQACFDFFGCVLSIPTQGGTVQGCFEVAPPELVPYLSDLEACHANHCSQFDPESAMFTPVKYVKCLKFNCGEALLGCFAHENNDDGCKRYVICAQSCPENGIACDLSCMQSLAAEDRQSTLEYLECIEKFQEIRSPTITDDLCDCLAICEVPYPGCDTPEG